MRRALGSGPATVEMLVERGFLSAADVDRLLERYHSELSRSVRASATCGRCGQPMSASAERLECAPCGILVKLQTPPQSETTPPEVQAAAREPANRIGKYVRLRELGRGGQGERAPIVSPATLA